MFAILRERSRSLPYAELLLILGLIIQFAVVTPLELTSFRNLGAKLPGITLSVVSEPVFTGAVLTILAVAGIAARISRNLILRIAMCAILVLANAYFLLALISPSFSLITGPSGPQGKH